MENVLVLGAIESFCDLVKDIKEKDMTPIVCDYYSNAPAKGLVKNAYDVSTMDVDALIEIALKHQVSGVITAFSDRNLQPGYEIAQKLKLPTFYSPEIIQKLTDKIQMKEHFRKFGFPILSYAVLDVDFEDRELDSFTFPVIMKPIDAYGSKGIFVCNSIEEIRQNFRNTVKESLNYAGKILVEEFYPVDEISIAAWVKKGISYVTCIYDVNRNFGEDIVLSNVRFPSKYTDRYLQEFKELTQSLTESFGIQEGPITVQCYIGEKGLKVGEYLYRLAGGSPYLYPVLMGGPNIAKMLIDFQCGKAIDYFNLENFQPVCRGWFYDIKVYAKEAGKIYYNITRDELKQKISNIADVIIYHESGSELYHVPKSGKEVIRIFYHQEENDKRSYREILNEVSDMIQITNEKGENITELRYPRRQRNLEWYDLKWRK